MKRKSDSLEARTNNEDASIILKVPRKMIRKWSNERFQRAQMKVFEILRQKKAVEEKPLLQHVLIEEAQKEIKDYVLLNFLLKHMIDSVIEKGERFKHSYSVDGAMEYWLEPTQASRPDEKMKELREDIKALKGEINNVKSELNRANEKIAKMLEVIKFNKLKEPCKQPRKSCRDSVIEKGERLKRSYSVDGATEYWLKPTQASRPDEEMKELREDIKALKGEISNVKRANEKIAKMLEVIKFNKLKEPCKQPRKSCRDSVIEKGERLKRSYSVDGATEYWLEPTQASRPDEEMKELREDIKALKGEISNVKSELNRANEKIAKMLEVIKFNKLKEPCKQP